MTVSLAQILARAQQVAPCAAAISMVKWLKECGCDYVEKPLHFDADDPLF
ncbi:MAG: hypothetical protein QGH58_05145 [Arenicellales bacterium]|nr:hypothetical protein [Arenicellales bacterium]MDP6791275.1 hypothetical protein [Arenicellales bacterium]MDP6918338.1 hypothetical protein [Arenicellales bacterium]